MKLKLFFLLIPILSFSQISFEKARDYLMKLPARMAKISERIVIPAESHIFKWVEPATLK